MEVMVPDEQLPLTLPGVESYEPTATGEVCIFIFNAPCPIRS